MAKINPIYAKRAAFRGGHWKAPLPPVCHFGWNIDNWISWIDHEGVWT